jgi:putative ABC transport system permease protein
MNILWMTFVTALRALRRNKLRSALTMLGIIIGVAAVITMVSIGRGADAAVQQQIQSLGNNLLMVVPARRRRTACARAGAWRRRSPWRRRRDPEGLSRRRRAHVREAADRAGRLRERELVDVRAGVDAVVPVGARLAGARRPLLRRAGGGGARPVALLGQTVVEHLFHPARTPSAPRSA